MKLILSACLLSLIAAAAIDYHFIRPLLNQKVTSDPPQFAGIVEIVTRHDKIPVARYAMSQNGRSNWDKIRKHLGYYGLQLSLDPNLTLRGFPHDWQHGGTVAFDLGSGVRFWAGGMEFTINDEPEVEVERKYPSVEGMLQLVSDDTKKFDLDRDERLFRNACSWFITDHGAQYVAPPHTNYTTLAAIISQQIMTNYVVVDEPKGATPPGIPDTAWTIQAKLNPEPEQWPERLVVNVESPGIWVHLGGGKYQWRRLPPF